MSRRENRSTFFTRLETTKRHHFLTPLTPLLPFGRLPFATIAKPLYKSPTFHAQNVNCFSFAFSTTYHVCTRDTRRPSGLLTQLFIYHWVKIHLWSVRLMEGSKLSLFSLNEIERDRHNLLIHCAALLNSVMSQISFSKRQV